MRWRHDRSFWPCHDLAIVAVLVVLVVLVLSAEPRRERGKKELRIKSLLTCPGQKAKGEKARKRKAENSEESRTKDLSIAFRLSGLSRARFGKTPFNAVQRWSQYFSLFPFPSEQ
jgi:hypothetical protein